MTRPESNPPNMTAPDDGPLGRSYVRIASLTRAKRLKRLHDATISLHDPGLHLNRQLRFNRQPAPPHLTLFFDDIDDVSLEAQGWRAPTEEHVRQALEFSRANPGSLLVHCHAGVSRSGAMGLMVIADRLGPGREREAFAEMLRVRDCAVPNERVLGFADRLLDRGGRLLEVYAEYLETQPGWKLRRKLQREVFEKTRPEDHVRHVRR